MMVADEVCFFADLQATRTMLLRRLKIFRGWLDGKLNRGKHAAYTGHDVVFLVATEVADYAYLPV
jgi:hypothetical protein